MAGNGTADIVLAECNGQAWLVRGEQHIDDLLGNTLPGDVSIEVITCESKSAIDAMWRSYGGGVRAMDMMWMIHPAIANRARGQVRGVSGEITVTFAEWSAALDNAAMAALRAAADMVMHRPEVRLAVVRHVADDAPAMAGEMANLRSGLLEAQLATLGVAAAQIIRETAPAKQPGQSERIVLVIRSDP